jgi:hypothetical protein
MHRSIVLLTAGMGMALLVSGCSGGGGGGNEPETTPYLPLAINNVWRYTFTDYSTTTAVGTAQVHALHGRARGLVVRPASVGTRQLTAEDLVWINGIEQIGGVDWFEAVSQYVGEDPQAPIYVRHNAQGLIRRIDATDPGYYLLRPPLAMGNSWTDPFDERVRLTITGINQTASVPEGVFGDCVIVEDVFTVVGDPVDIITSWYAYGVGMVRQEHHVGATLVDTLELRDHTLVP